MVQFEIAHTASSNIELRVRVRGSYTNTTRMLVIGLTTNHATTSGLCIMIVTKTAKVLYMYYFRLNIEHMVRTTLSFFVTNLTKRHQFEFWQMLVILSFVIYVSFDIQFLFRFDVKC